MRRNDKSELCLVTGIYNILLAVAQMFIHFIYFQKVMQIRALKSAKAKIVIKVGVILIEHVLITEQFITNIQYHFWLYLLSHFTIQKILDSVPIIIHSFSDLVTTSYLIIRYIYSFELYSDQLLLAFCLVLVQLAHSQQQSLLKKARKKKRLQHSITMFVKKFYRDIIQKIPQGLAILDSEQQLIFHNQKLQKILNLPGISQECFITKLK